MTKLIVLPGNSPKNKAWGEGMAAHFGGLFDDVYMQAYKHWETGEEVIDFEYEAARLAEEAAKGGELYIFAKSFGSILTFLSTSRGLIAPERCVFFGIPLNLVEKQGLWQGSWAPIEGFKTPAIAFHNEHDPVADYAFTSRVLAEHGSGSVRIIPTSGDNHTYDDFSAYEPHIKDFLTS